MKNVSWIYFIVTLFLPVLGGCSSEEAGPEGPVAEAITLELHVTAAVATRADGTATPDGQADAATRAVREDEVKTLFVTFYKDGQFVGMSQGVAQTAGNDNTDNDDNIEYTVELPQVVGRTPDTAVAFVNIAEEGVPTCALSDLPNRQVAAHTDDEGYMVMSSRLTGEGGYTQLTPAVLAGTEKAVLEVEHVAAKVTASWTNPAVTLPTVTKGQTADTRSLALVLDGWTVSATEKGSWLLRHHTVDGSSDLKFTDWAHSLTWESADVVPQKSGDVTDATSLSYAVEAGMERGTAGYWHETTRPQTAYGVRNAVPVLVIAAHCLVDGATQAATFYRYGENAVFTESEYWDAIAADQTALYKSDKSKPSGSELKALAENVTADGGKNDGQVTVQLKQDADLSTYKDSEGNAAAAETVNAALKASCPVMEKYLDGKCYYAVPITHSKFAKDTEAASQPLGAYGLVRNNSYKITVESIDGLGLPVGFEGQYLLEAETGSTVTARQVTASFTITGWDDPGEQTVKI